MYLIVTFVRPKVYIGYANVVIFIWASRSARLDRFVRNEEAASPNLALSTTNHYPDHRKMDSVTVHRWITMSSLRCLWPCCASFCCRIPPWSWCSHVPSISTPIQCQRHCPDISIRTSCATCGGRISRLDRTVERTG